MVLSLRHGGEWSDRVSTNINYNVVSDIAYVDDIEESSEQV